MKSLFMSVYDSSNFAKINALGNEIIVVDVEHADKLSAIVEIFLSNKTIYFEQLMAITPSVEADFNLYIYNNDGTQAGACGNGMRATMQYIYYKYRKKAASFLINHKYLYSEYINDDRIIVNLGRPSFTKKDLHLSQDVENLAAVKLSENLPAAHLISVGNPHAIFFMSELPSIEEIKQIGPNLEHHEIFLDRCNISFAQIMDKKHIKLRTWERGAGLTRACGSASCATHIAAYIRGLVDDMSIIENLGGELQISWSQDRDIIMEGPSKLEFFGKYEQGKCLQKL